MSENNSSQAAFGTDVKRLPLKELVKRIGPGLIATGIVIGPGAVTTSAMLGANYGYALIWLILPIIFMGITFMMTTNRLAIVTGLPTIHAIQKYYGPIASAVVSIAVFLSCLFFTMKYLRHRCRDEPDFRAELEDRVGDHDCRRFVLLLC